MRLVRWADRDNYREVEQEWKYEWIFYILSNIGLAEEVLMDCFPEGGFEDFGIDHRQKLRKHCDDHNITIVDDRDGGLKIYVRISYDGKEEQVLIAEWKKCLFNLREDREEVNPSKKLYIEIVANPWATFEEQDENNE